MHQGPAKATVAEKIDPPEWLEGKGHLVDDDGGIMPYIVEAGAPLATVDEGDTVTIENVKVEDRDGVPTAVFSGITEITIRESTSTSADGDVTAAADGGSQEQQEEQESEEPEEEDTPEVAGVTVPTDAEGTKANAQRIAQYVDERSPMPEPVLKKTLTLDVDLMTPEEFDTALSKGTSEYGILMQTDAGIAANL
jgi:hypothetical protein